MRGADEYVQSIEIFSDLSEEEFDIVRSVMKDHEYKEGEVLFFQNDDGNELFIVEKGCIAIEVHLPDGKKLEISEIHAGNFLGEMSIFENAPRSATCTAKEPSYLLSLHKDDFFGLMQVHPSVAAKMMYRMLNITASRLKNTDNFLSDMVQWGETARRRAVIDEFTGLYNRRFLESALAEQFSKVKREKGELSLAMVDLDNFGSLNKAYGEEVGDDVILAAVKVFRSVCDETDILVRYGGDEFTFILPGRHSRNAKHICDTICAELRALTVLEGMDGEIKQVTSSIGIATFPEHGNTSKALMEKADSAVYTAKEQGRDQAVVAAV
jgi:diguanylate cyclase (GGDEF)-like protein